MLTGSIFEGFAIGETRFIKGMPGSLLCFSIIALQSQLLLLAQMQARYSLQLAEVNAPIYGDGLSKLWGY